jgi:hypothetical protein
VKVKVDGNAPAAKMKSTASALQKGKASTSEFSSALKDRLKLNSAVALSMVLPGAHPTVRMSDPWQAKRTAVASLHDQFILPVPETVSTASPVSAGGNLVGVSKDPLHAIMYLHSGSVSSNYKFVESPFEADSVGFSLPGSNLRHEIPIDAGRFDSGFELHGQYVYPFHVDGRQCLLINKQFSSGIVPTVTMRKLSGFYEATDVLEIVRYDGNNWTTYDLVTGSTSATLGGTFADGCSLYAFNVQTTMAMTVGLEVNYAGAQYGFFPLPSLNSGSGISSIRVAAASVMLHSFGGGFPGAGGTITGFQTDANDMLSDVMTGLSTEANATSLDYKKGMYAFMKPDQEDKNFVDIFRTHNGAVHTRSKEGFGPWLIVSSEVPLGTPTAPFLAIREVQYSFAFGVEYEGSSQWADYRVAQTSVEQYDEAMLQVRDMPQYFENPMHVKDILRFLKNTARFTWKVAPGMLKVLRMIAPQYQPIYNAADSIIGALS